MVQHAPAATPASTRQPSAARTPGLTRIAAGVDGFPEGRDAAALGHLLAGATGADLLLVAVHSAALLPVPPELSFKSARQEAQRILREVRESDAPDARTAIASDYSVPRALLRVARRHRCGLLILGSNREGPEGHVQIGARTRQLLGQFKYALAVAPRGLHAHPLRLRRIGVGWDGGPESAAALALAGSIAVGAGAKVQVQAIVDDRTPPFAHSGLGLLDGGWDELVEAEMTRLGDQATAATSAIGAQVKVAVARGRPSDALLELSETVDLLVIGSRRWGPSARVLLGSTGEALMHGSACPVLAVPRPAA
jgi:nucleotide-binding universal stress UspA family protein